MRLHSRLACVLAFALAATVMAGSARAADDKVDFSRDVLPILAGKCFTCHGPDAGQRKADLRLDVHELAIKPLGSGDTPIVPGKPDKSAVIARISTADADTVMPPPSSKKSLSDHEKDVLKRWIEQGANYKTHWSFTKPIRPTPPAVQNQAWVRNEIDRYVLARLEAEKLQPAAEADRYALVRRVYQDLLGLTPSVAETEAFVNDASPDAFEKLIERVLRSPRYGEKMAQGWLDQARFGDTNGYHYDSTRQMWLWRNYVIDSFNANKPFNQFTIEQLAGDLLPNATEEQKIASGFNRNARFNEEGGADPEEFLVRYAVDRTNTLGQVWFGMTLGCAECHSHKYDPISQKEYYQLYAFFNSLNEPGAQGHGQKYPPLITVATPDQKRALETARVQLAEVEAKLKAELAKIVYNEPPAAEPTKVERKDIVWIEDDVPAGAMLQGDGPQPWVWVTAGPGPNSGQVLGGKRAMKRTSTGMQQHFFTNAKEPLVVNSPDDKLFAHVWIDPIAPAKTVMLQFNDGAWEHRAYWGDDKAYLAGTPDGPGHHKVGPLPELGKWVRIEVAAKDVGLSAGAKINGWAFTQVDGEAYYDVAGINTAPAGDPRALRSQLAWEEGAKGDSKLPGPVRDAAKVEPGKRNDLQKALLREYYLRYVYAGTRDLCDPLNKQVEDLGALVKRTEEAMPFTLVSEEMPQPREAFVLIRGDFLQRGEKVERDVPAIFPSLAEGAKRDRLALAKWLVSGDHPLVARVVVNRLWAQFFGAGLVKTPGDFGTQGQLPSHPQLLDYLATEFVRSGWDIKKLQRLILLSATYRQSSSFHAKTSPTHQLAAEKDPENRLLSHMPRFRLTAEEIRDQALYIAGLLSQKVGGPSVMPYQPADFYKGKNENWPWMVAKGEDLYRRGLYTFWRRTSPYPMFTIFDAPSREECCVQRPRTNTPLQALATLNDPTFVDASRAFGERIVLEGPTDVAGRLVFAFQMALARKPTAAELAVLRDIYQQQLDFYSAQPKDAAELAAAPMLNPKVAAIPAGERAAWTATANAILNLDETVTRE